MENNLNVWLDVLGGFSIIAGMVLLIKTFYGLYFYKNGIYKAVYSNYIEYSMRKRSIEKLSQSYYFKSRFGFHRIFYQIVSHKGEKIPQAYVLIILTSGLYIANIKNQNGRVEAKLKGDFKYTIVGKTKKGEKPVERILTMKNPLDEVMYFQSKIQEKLKSFNMPIYRIVVFPDKAQVIWKNGEKKDSSIIQRKELFDAINNIHDKHEKVLNESQINAIYMALAAETLEMEKRK